jgi:ABC-type nitrate/sulfonate/bicarbonate transport system substrate-binding protein
MKKILFAVLGIGVIVGIFMFLQRTPEVAKPYIVRVGNTPILSSKLPLEITKQKNFFQEAGVSVKITEFATSNLLNDALVRGDIDITPQVSLLPLLSSESIAPGKVKIFSVMDLTDEHPYDSIITKEESLIHGIADLAGKKIGVFQGTTATNTLKAFFKDKGIDDSSMQFVQLAPAEHLAALASGSIDALYTYEPAVTIALDKGGYKKIYGSVFAAQLNHSPLGAGLINAQFAKEHPIEAQRVVTAFNKTYDFLRTHERESRDINATLFQLSPSVRNAVPLVYFFHSDTIDRSLVNRLVDIFVAIGELKTKVDLTNAYYPQ